jgi:hypothetical protein
MNYVENLKSAQSKKLFQIFNSICMQSLNIFEAREDFLFEFTTLSGVWKFERIFLLSQAHLSAAHFVLTAQDGHQVPRATLILVATLSAQ